jgi:phage baseplate assembly protein V
MDRKTGNAIRNAAATRLVLTMVNDSSKMQSIQARGLDGEVVDKTERFQNYGFSSVPHEGEAVGLPVGGDRTHMVVVAIDDRGARMVNLNPGEVVVYNKNGDYIKLGENNKIEIKTKEWEQRAEDKIYLETKDFQLEVNGPITIKGTTVRIEGDISFHSISGEPIKFNGDINMQGNLNTTGNVTISDGVQVGGDINASGTIHGSHVTEG